MKLGLLTQSTLDSAVWHFKLISFSLMFFAIPISEFALVDDVDAREWNETLINHPMQGMKRSQHQAPIWHFVHPSWYSDFIFFCFCQMRPQLCLVSAEDEFFLWPRRRRTFYARSANWDDLNFSFPPLTVGKLPSCFSVSSWAAARRLMHLSVSLGNRKTRRRRKCHPSHSIEATRSRLFLIFRVKWVGDTTCWCRRMKVFGLTIFRQTLCHASFATHPVVEMKLALSSCVTRLTVIQSDCLHYSIPSRAHTWIQWTFFPSSFHFLFHRLGRGVGEL